MAFPLNIRPREQTVVRTAAGRVLVLSVLGEGAAGIVFAGRLDGRLDVAFKIEKPPPPGDPGDGQIQNEYRMGMRMSKKSNTFPKLFAASFGGRFKYLVMERLGSSLSAWKKERGGRFSLPLAVDVGVQILGIVRTLHREGVIGYDFHLGNFLRGRGKKSNRIYLIDLGLAYPYRLPDGGHIAYEKDGKTLKDKNKYYATAHDMAGYRCSRRDELERVMYILIDLVIGKLPWAGKTGDETLRMKTKKNMSRDICQGEASGFYEALHYARSLGFQEAPDYDKMKQLIIQAR